MFHVILVSSEVLNIFKKKFFCTASCFSCLHWSSDFNSWVAARPLPDQEEPENGSYQSRLSKFIPTSELSLASSRLPLPTVYILFVADIPLEPVRLYPHQNPLLQHTAALRVAAAKTSSVCLSFSLTADWLRPNMHTCRGMFRRPPSSCYSFPHCRRNSLSWKSYKSFIPCFHATI